MKLLLKSIIGAAFISAMTLFTANGVYSNESPIEPSKKEFVLCTWNLAYYYAYDTVPRFSNKSNIDAPIYSSKLQRLREVIYEKIKPDVIALNEYSSVYGIDSTGIERKAVDVLFDGFTTWFEGGATDRGASNAIFGNIRMGNFSKSLFDCLYGDNRKFENSYDRYYVTGDIVLDGNLIKLVSVHLGFGIEGMLEAQIEELIDKFKNYERVIICGDFNTNSKANISKFVSAGYVCGNNGKFRTFYKKSLALDNIFVKGLKINNMQMIDTRLSDHCPLFCTISLV